MRLEILEIVRHRLNDPSSIPFPSFRSLVISFSRFIKRKRERERGGYAIFPLDRFENETNEIKTFSNVIVVIEGFYAVKSWRIQIWDGVVETFNLDRNEYREILETRENHSSNDLSSFDIFRFELPIKINPLFCKITKFKRFYIYIYSHVEIYKNAIIGVEFGAR